MASLRDGLAEALVAQINALPGWTADRRDALFSMNFAGKRAVVNILGETKRVGTELFYDASLRIGVMVFVNREDADPSLDAGNEVRYLDRAIAEVEVAVHSMTWPLDVRPTVTGHEQTPPAEQNVLSAGLELAVEYQHNFNDPSTFNPSWPG